MMLNIGVLILGYLIGSVNPAYFLGKIIKGIDIRKVGSKNAGTTNVYQELGLIPAIITVIWDLGKGLLSMWLAYTIGADLFFAYTAGIFAIIGHIFPFYLHFKGGQGAATSTGLLIYYLIKLLEAGYLPWLSLVVLAISVVLILFITKNKGYLALVVMPALFFIIWKNCPVDYNCIFAFIVIANLFGLNIYESSKNHLFDFKKKTLESVMVWRTLARPLAVIFPIAYLYWDKSIILWITGIIGAIFLSIDILRLISNKINFIFFEKIKVIFKKKERKSFSSITLFFIAMFIVILIFSKSIAIISIMYLIFGDVFAKFFGLEFGKIRLWHKTLEGSTAHLVACLLVGYVMFPFLDLPVWQIIIAAFIATLAEVFPSNINDNFIVPIATAVSLYIMQII